MKSSLSQRQVVLHDRLRQRQDRSHTCFVETGQATTRRVDRRAKAYSVHSFNPP